jgi:glycosyltransferase involved in cell wall biosynthesis
MLSQLPSPDSVSLSLNILHCIPSLGNGGAERQLSILAPAQIATGARVHVAYVYAGAHLRTLQDSGIELHQIPASGNHDVRIVKGLWSLLSSEAPDVVHTWLPQMDLVGGVLALSRGRPWILSERSSGAAYMSRLKERVLRRNLGRWADAVVANSEAGSALWSGTLRRGARSHVIRNTPPLDAITSVSRASVFEMGVQANQRVVIFVGRLSTEKNIDLLLSVADAVCRASDTVFLICGDGPLRHKAEAYVRASAYEERIRLLGERDDVWGLMKAGDAFVSTSSFEGQPNAVLEAMACSCPLVVSDIPAHREFLDDETATIVPLDKDGFVGAILNVLQGSETIRRRTLKAKLRISAITPANAAAAYEAVYREAILRHNRCAE